MTTRRQHYVWRKYLEPWTFAQGKSHRIWCLRRENHEPFAVDTTKVAVERDFYRLIGWEPTDAEFVRALLFRENTLPHLRALNEGWIAQFEGFFALHDLVLRKAGHDRQVRAELEKSLIQFQEADYQRMEGDFLPLLAALLGGDARCIHDDQHGPRLCAFLAHQYLRTKAMRDRVRRTFENTSFLPHFDRTWPILRYVMATNVGFSIFAGRHSIPLTLLQAPQGVAFITSDQPVVNLRGRAGAELSADDFELYYPLSPGRAAILSADPVYLGSANRAVSVDLVDHLNGAIERVAHEQLFGESREALFIRARTFCGLAES